MTNHEKYQKNCSGIQTIELQNKLHIFSGQFQLIIFLANLDLKNIYF